MAVPRERTAAGAGDAAPEETLAAVARATDRLRAGQIVVISDPEDESVEVLAVETATPASLKRFGTSRAIEPRLVLTHERARTLKIRLYTPDVVALPLATPLDLEQLRAIADPTADLARVLGIHTNGGAKLELGMDALRITADDRQSTSSPALEVIILGGLPIREPVAWYGPFVMNTKAELDQAVDDYRAGRLGVIPPGALMPHVVR